MPHAFLLVPIRSSYHSFKDTSDICRKFQTYDYQFDMLVTFPQAYPLSINEFL